jgi:hypothetical protein
MSSPSRSNLGRFAKGRSGNSKGRPANRRVAPDQTFESLSQRITVNGPDGPRDMSPEELVERTTFQAATAGKAMAIRIVTKWMLEYRAGLAKDDPTPNPHPLKVFYARNPHNADEALQLLGIAAPNPEDGRKECIPLLLALWPVQVALSRRRGGRRLTADERDNIRRVTSDPDSLRWPRETKR